jgi:glycosyltransferase involved in cell wall biosynthesis
VIIIFLDAAAFIAQAIESVLGQTEHDWELLLVDDGSTDGSTATARGYAARLPERICYLEHPGHQNRGMSASRNLGLAHARGEFVAFLDADDVWLPEWLERHLDSLEKHDEVGMVYGPTLYWHSWSPDAANRGRDFVGHLRLDTRRPLAPPTALVSFLETRGGSLPGICSILVRREVARQVGGFEESFRGAYEDQVFLSKVCLHSTVLILDEVLDKYRQHHNSYTCRSMAMGEYDPDKPHPARERYLVWLEGYLRTHGWNDPRLLAALKEELWPYRRPWSYALHQTRAFRRMTRLAQRRLPPQAYAWIRQQVRRSLALSRG